MKKKLWQEVSEVLVDKIKTGEWPVGSIIPGEVELSRRLNVSRDTVRKALEALVKAEFIERKPHAGTRVKAKVQNGKFLHELSDIKAIDQYSNQFPRKIEEVEEVVVTKELSEKLGLPKDDIWVRLKNVRLANKQLNEAVVVTYVYIRKDVSFVAEEAQKEPKALIVSLIEEVLQTECVEVRQTFSATTMDQYIAEHFNSQAGEPCLKIIRSYLDKNGYLITASESYHPADRFAFTTVSKKKRYLSFLP